MLKTRVATSVVFVLVLVVAFFFFYSIFFNLLFTALCLIAVHEIYNAFQFGKRSLYIYIGFVPVVVLVMLSDSMKIRSFLMPVIYAFLIFLVIILIAHINTLNFAKLSGMLVFSAIVVFCFYSLINLKYRLPRDSYGHDSIYFFILILAYAWGGDTAAYFTGMLWGKHKLAPRVSPKKTIEGAIGGVAGSIILGLIVTFVYLQFVRQNQTDEIVSGKYYLVVVAFGAVASVLGILGDLFASAIKRQCGIKDFGSLLPGHGGVLDRFDSLIFIAPLVAMVLRVLFAFFVSSE